MKLKHLMLAAVLAVTSVPASAFDLGKFLEERVNKELNKDKPAQTAPAQTSPAPAQTAAAPQPAQQKVDPTQLGFALFGDYTLEEEVRIGRQIAGNLLGAVPLVRDDALQRYVNLVGNWVAQQSGRNEVTWRFGVLDTEAINAFAAPGGYVFVTKGLYRMLDNEAELAGVLGHEIAHITKKHHLKVLKQSTLIGALGQAASQKAQDSDQVVQNLIGNGA
ncbi:MAG: M48 family metalloprotease, partial [Gammaproteobacteria bacterium]